MMPGVDPRDSTVPIVCWVVRRGWQYRQFYLPGALALTYEAEVGKFPAGYRVFYGMVPIQDEV